MARDDPMMRFRAPEKLKREIEGAAARNGRSLNSEIIHRLEAAETSDSKLKSYLQEEAADLEYLLEGAKTEAERLSKELKEQKDHIIDNGPVDGLLLGQLIVSHSWALERVADYERRLRRIKRVLGDGSRE